MIIVVTSLEEKEIRVCIKTASHAEAQEHMFANGQRMHAVCTTCKCFDLFTFFCASVMRFFGCQLSQSSCSYTYSVTQSLSIASLHSAPFQWKPGMGDMTGGMVFNSFILIL